VNLNPAHCSHIACSVHAGGPCDVCTTGKFKATPGKHDCEWCIAGKYGPTTGNAKCTPCLAGTYSVTTGANTSSTCLPCLAGTYSGPATSECAKCGAGKFSSTIGANTSSLCLSCPAYSTSPAGCTNVSFCKCMAGYKKMGSVAIDELVAVTCVECEAGKYKDFIGSATSCQDCRPGTFLNTSSADNSSYCLPCPASETSNKSGATECDCIPGFIRDCITKVSLCVLTHVYVCMREILCF